MRAEYDRLPMIKPPHVVGGAGYVHSIPNYGRVLKEGLDRYAERVAALPEVISAPGWKRFSRASAHITPGRWRCWRRRERTRSSKSASPRAVSACARSLYEAVVCWNFIYFIDGCDNPGRLDADLIEYYQGEDITPILREIF